MPTRSMSSPSDESRGDRGKWPGLGDGIRRQICCEVMAVRLPELPAPLGLLAPVRARDVWLHTLQKLKLDSSPYLV